MTKLRSHDVCTSKESPQQHAMVSTRGVKFKFSEGEKVLCYEPDSSKAKVLYDSKVLELVVDRDSRGKKVAEYLIHFSGWNSSWDRCVAEEFILPDTPQNRKLQKRLAEEAAQKLLQAGRAKRRKVPAILKESINKKLSEKSEKKEKSESSTTTDDSSSSDVQQSSEQEEAEEHQESEEDEVEEEEEEEVAAEGTFCLDVPQLLKEKLEDDRYFVTCKKKLLRLPAKPNVVGILEDYLRHYARHLAERMCAKKAQEPKAFTNHIQPAEIARTRLELCKEAIDGLRILFDHTLADLLLYGAECRQHKIITAVEGDKVVTTHAVDDKDVTAKKDSKKEEPSVQKEGSGGHRSRPRKVSHGSGQDESSSSPPRRPSGSPTERRALRSADRQPSAETCEEKTERKVAGTTIEQESRVPSQPRREENPVEAALSALLDPSWRLLPPEEEEKETKAPSLVYGAVHLLRLFVKLPDLLSRMNMSERKLEHLRIYLTGLLEHMAEQADDLFSPSCYENAQQVMAQLENSS